MYYPPNYPYVPQAVPVPPPDPQYLRRMQEERELRRTSTGLGLTLVITILMMQLLPILTNLILGNKGMLYNANITPLQQYLETGVIYVFSVVVPFMTYLLFKRGPIGDTLSFKRVSGKLTAACMLLGLLVCMLANFAANLFLQNLQSIGINPSMPGSAYDNSPAFIALYALSVAIAPAIIEEFAFRGIILGSLRKFGDGFAVIVSSFMFAMMHGNLVQIPFAFVVGLVLGYLVVGTGSMWPSIFVHFANNLFAVVMDVISHNVNGDYYNILETVCVILIFLLGFAALLVILKKRKGFFTIQASDSSLTFNEKFGKFFVNWGMLPAFVLLCILTVASLFYA